MKVKLLTILLVVSCGLGIHACHRTNEYDVHANRDLGETFAAAEHDFLIKAAIEDRSQVEMARVAEQKSDNDEVSDYARMLATDHSRNLEQVSLLLQEADMNPPDLMSAEMRESFEKLWSLSGSEFDREYVNTTVDHHRTALDTFRRFKRTDHSTEARIYANDALPMLQDHLRKGQGLQSKLFGGDIE